MWDKTTFNWDILELIGNYWLLLMVLFLYVSDTHLSFNTNLVCLVLNGDMVGYTGIILGGILGNFWWEFSGVYYHVK